MSRKNSFEQKFREIFDIQENVKSADFLDLVVKTLRKEPLMVTIVWHSAGLTFRTTANTENAESVRQLATNLRSVAEQLDSMAFNLVSKENGDDSESISRSVVGEDK